MDYRVLLQEENDAVRERLELSLERIRQMEGEEMRQPYGNYFKKTAKFLCLIEEVLKKRALLETDQKEALSFKESRTLEELAQENHRLYEDILPGNYEKSMANPEYSAKQFGDGFGPLFAFLYTELRTEISYAFEGRLLPLTVLNEVFLEVYNLFNQAWEEENEAPQLQEVKDALYWYVSDYADIFLPWRIREGIDPSLNFAVDMIQKEDLSSPRYLYLFGEYISDTELKLVEFLNSLPEETVNRMADTYTEGYRKGFQVMGRDLSKKKTVVLEYPLGFERMIKKAIENFEAMGLSPILYRWSSESINRRPNGKRGYFSTSANRQYEYDHRYDSALYMGNAFKERKLSILKTAYEEYKDLAGVCAGPAVVETFGEKEFVPVNKETAFSLNPHQEELTISYANESRQVVNQYMPGEETSFTIIAFPKPEIGPDFEEIFKETIEINTLDYDLYQQIQKRLIDTLDTAQYVTVTGREGNETALKIMLHTLKNPQKETNFENCVADVNIPLGEVFTSPVLAGTEGLLHIKKVYVEDYLFKNLRVVLKDGKVTDFSCENFDGEDGDAQGKELVKQVILRGHNWLPLGEFAIGTNTRAYAMAQKFGIEDKLPILIAEKMGPHFAVGDTCYSFSEDSPMYNPDGKEVIARDNEISILRKEDPSRAYFNCHTDLTIPYSELGDICAVGADKKEVALIRGGRFVLEGTEKLNEALGDA